MISKFNKPSFVRTAISIMIIGIVAMAGLTACKTQKQDNLTNPIVTPALTQEKSSTEAKTLPEENTSGNISSKNDVKPEKKVVSIKYHYYENESSNIEYELAKIKKVTDDKFSGKIISDELFIPVKLCQKILIDSTKDSGEFLRYEVNKNDGTVNVMQSMSTLDTTLKQIDKVTLTFLEDTAYVPIKTLYKHIGILEEQYMRLSKEKFGVEENSYNASFPRHRFKYNEKDLSFDISTT